MVSCSYKKIGLLTIAVGLFGSAVYSVNQNPSNHAQNTVMKPTVPIAMIDKVEILVTQDEIKRDGLSQGLSFSGKLTAQNSETTVLKYQPYIEQTRQEQSRVSANFAKYSRSLLKSNSKASIKTYLDKKRRSGNGFIALISPDEIIRAHTNEIKMQALEYQWVQRSQDEGFDAFASTELASAKRLMREKSDQMLTAYAEYEPDAGTYLGSLLAHLEVEKIYREQKVLIARAEQAASKKSNKHKNDKGGESLDQAHQNANEKLVAASRKIREASNSLALAYAPSKKKSDAPFDKIIVQGSRTTKLDINKEDHEWVNNTLPKRVSSSSEQKCLTSGIYFEARGETERGMAAVAQVILNRVKNPKYPQTICGVVYQNKHMRNRCQFSFACDGVPDVVLSPSSWRQAKRVARESVTGKLWIKEVGSATHYHATYVRPRWASTMHRMKKIGLHIFYRTYGGGWS